MFDEIGNIRRNSTVMATIEKIVAFSKNIPSGLCFVLLRIATKRTGEIPQIGILLLEVTQAGRN
jgi:hypothetical protein